MISQFLRFCFLCHLTSESITIGRAEDVYNAARQASIHDAIMAMPAGYQTKVGERGLKVGLWTQRLQ